MKTDTPTAETPFLVINWRDGEAWVTHFYASREWIEANRFEHERGSRYDFGLWEWADAGCSTGNFRFIRVL